MVLYSKEQSWAHFTLSRHRIIDAWPKKVAQGAVASGAKNRCGVMAHTMGRMLNGTGTDTLCKRGSQIH